MKELKKVFKNYIKSGDLVYDIGGLADVLHKVKSNHQLIKDFSSDVICIDPFEKPLKEAREKGFNVISKDVFDFNPKRKADVIFAGEIIEHMENQGLFIDKLKQLLKPNGTIIITTPNSTYLMECLNILIKGKIQHENLKCKPVNDVFPSGHFHIHNLRTLTQLCLTKNLKIIEVRYKEHNKYKWLNWLNPRFRNSIIIVCQKEYGHK